MVDSTSIDEKDHLLRVDRVVDADASRIVDDATKRLLYAQLTDEGESSAVIMRALGAVLKQYGLPQALYTDRAAGPCTLPPRAAPRTARASPRSAVPCTSSASSRSRATRRKRGRSERLNRTVQERLVKELTVAGIATLAAANRYLRERFQPLYDELSSRPPADPASAFVPLGPVDLTQILCQQDDRVVGRDNIVRLNGQLLQIAKQPGRSTCAGLRVQVRQHLTGHYSVWWGPRCSGASMPTGVAFRGRPRNAFH
jgi:hypothetical protein